MLDLVGRAVAAAVARLGPVAAPRQYAVALTIAAILAVLVQTGNLQAASCSRPERLREEVSAEHPGVQLKAIRSSRSPPTVAKL